MGQLLWAEQGVTAKVVFARRPRRERYIHSTYVSWEATYSGSRLAYTGIGRGHDLATAKAGDIRRELAAAAIDHECVRDGAAVIVIAAVYGRTTTKYGQRGSRYVHMEAGRAAQNVYLQATALGLGIVAVAAFLDADVKRIVELPSDHEPLYLMPVGRSVPE